MKIYLIISVLTTLLAGVNKSAISFDDTNIVVHKQSDKLLGKWNLNSTSLKIVDADGVVVQEMGDQPAAGQLTMQFEFKVDKKVVFHGSRNAVNETNEPTNEAGTYELIDNKLTVNINNEPLTFNIVFNDWENLHLEVLKTMDYQDKKVSMKTLYKYTRPGR